MSFDPESQPHRRYDPLSGRWVLVSPQRNLRPWLGQSEPLPPVASAAYDPTCYLCPGNRRANGAVNPSYEGTFGFENDFPALLPMRTGSGVGPGFDDELLRAEPTSGVCRVICFSPRHDLTLAKLGPIGLHGVIETWAAETAMLGQSYRWVQVFENKGAMMGCSNPHPHGQIWASSALPSDAATEDRHQRDYASAHGRPLLVDYAAREHRESSRVVHENEEFLAVVPFWATWPFETMLLPRRQVAHLHELAPEQRKALASLLDVVLKAYDLLFDVSLPYCMGWHGAPFDPGSQAHWQLHGHIYPPLVRSSTVKKFMVGYEMLAEAQRDITPEQAAERLRQLVRRRL